MSWLADALFISINLSLSARTVVYANGLPEIVATLVTTVLDAYSRAVVPSPTIIL